MARSIVLGNGNMLVCLDRFGQVRDFYFPYVGLENHVGRDLVHKVGVWTDPAGQGGGGISWLTDVGWSVTVSYVNETMASNIVCENRSLSLKLSFLDIVYNEKNIFLRRITVENLSGNERRVKVFVNQQFQIGGNNHADTAYYNPAAEAIIHYKGRRVFLVGGSMDGRSFDEYGIGLFKIEGKEGIWRDAEDGVLSKNPIEHGQVDSAVGWSMTLPPGGSKEIAYWITAAETYREAQALQRYVLVKTPAHLLESTQDFWKAWLMKRQFSFIGLDDNTVDVFKNSLFIIRAHSDNRGGIIASADSDNFQYGRDTYGYVWPRDAAFITLALDRAGHQYLSQKFYSFADDVITDEGYILHKYQPDRSLGSSWHPWVKDGHNQLAIQEDETAAVIFAFWKHYQVAKDLEFVESVYNSLVKRAAEFMVSYREPQTGLPAPSYDLWEERYGISTFTSASVFGGLSAASNFAALLGKDEDTRRYAREAEEIRQAILKHLWDEERGYFSKMIGVHDGKIERDATCDASAFYGIMKFGVLPADDECLIRSVRTTREKLSRGITIGGLARYEGDKYYSVSDSAAGNPWYITTLWALQYDIARAAGPDDLKKIANELSSIARRAAPGSMFSEQLNPVTGEQLSVSPLAWSHAEFVETVIAYMEKLEKLGLGEMCYPVE